MLKIWDVATGRQIMTTRLSDVYFIRIRFRPDGKRLDFVGLQSPLCVPAVRGLDAETGSNVLPPLGEHTLDVQDGVFSPDGKRLATGSLDKTVRMWDLATGQET